MCELLDWQFEACMHFDCVMIPLKNQDGRFKTVVSIHGHLIFFMEGNC